MVKLMVLTQQAEGNLYFGFNVPKARQLVSNRDFYMAAFSSQKSNNNNNKTKEIRPSFKTQTFPPLSTQT